MTYYLDFALDLDRSMQCWWSSWSARSLRHYIMPQELHNGHWKSLRCPDCCLTLSHILRSYKSNKTVWRISSRTMNMLWQSKAKLTEVIDKLCFSKISLYEILLSWSWVFVIIQWRRMVIIFPGCTSSIFQRVFTDDPSCPSSWILRSWGPMSGPALGQGS